MFRLIGVLFLPILAQFLIHGWREMAVGIGQASVDTWRDNYNRDLRKVLHGE